MTPTPASLGLQDTCQVAWAIHSLAVARPICKAHGLTEDQTKRACDIVLEAELDESDLYMYANKYNPESLALPHDQVGSDHGSVGLLQQQVAALHSTAFWGTTAQCMDVNYSVKAFLTGVPDHHKGLLQYSWFNMSNWQAAQAVQGSFDPTGSNYRRHDAHAIQIRKALWTAPVPPKPAPSHLPVGTYRVRNGDTLVEIAHRYSQSWITWQSIARINHLANPNNIYVGQLLVIG